MNIRNLLYQGKLILLLFIVSISNAQTITNYIGNGSFEDLYNCNTPDMFQKLKYWRTMDSASYGNCLLANVCYSNIPQTYFGFQYPRSGNSFAINQQLCFPNICNVNNNRGYIRNRLKSKLIAGKSYCVKFYVCVPEGSSASIDSHGAYFGDNSLDTITKFKIPLTYLNPQIQNPTGNIIGDTLNWVPITGTFVANGTENFCVIGNFKSDAATNFTMQVKNAGHNVQYPPCSSCTTSVAYIDDVSCIPLDLPAYAGPDVFGIPGNTVYIGRPQDVGIDEACTWYNLSNTTTPIANAAGFTHTIAAITQTYVVKQDICGVIKYDTVVVYASAVGVENVTLSEVEAWLRVFPNPTNEIINVKLEMINKEAIKNYKSDSYWIEIVNVLGQTIKQQPIEHNNISIDVKDFSCGVYTILIKTEVGTLSKKVVIEK